MAPAAEEAAQDLARGAEELGVASRIALLGAPENGRAALAFETEEGAFAVELTPEHILAIVQAAPALLAGICD